MTEDKKLAFATRAIHAGQAPDPTTGAIMTPIANGTFLAGITRARHMANLAREGNMPRCKRSW